MGQRETGKQILLQYKLSEMQLCSKKSGVTFLLFLALQVSEETMSTQPGSATPGWVLKCMCWKSAARRKRQSKREQKAEATTAISAPLIRCACSCMMFDTKIKQVSVTNMP